MIHELVIENFKRFAYLKIDFAKSKDHLVIYGPNGSGKTQLLWALMLFFRGTLTSNRNTSAMKWKYS